jgi:hypothetical protein
MCNGSPSQHSASWFKSDRWWYPLTLMGNQSSTGLLPSCPCFQPFPSQLMTRFNKFDTGATHFIVADLQSPHKVQKLQGQDGHSIRCPFQVLSRSFVKPTEV